MIDLSQYSNQQILALTAIGENRGGGVPGMQSVLNTIMNRANHPTWWGDNPRDVCLKPEQFDTWNPSDPNYDFITNISMKDPLYINASNMATMAINGILPDITNGSTYYFAQSIDNWPYWAVGHTPAATIAGQLFFNDIS